MLAAFVLFMGYSYRAARRESAKVVQELKEAVQEELKGAGDAPKSAARSIATVIAGLVALVAGSQLIVFAAVEAAGLLGISPLIIGLTIVALGTSLPELATSVVAARRQEADIVGGNVIGSNIFNLLLVLAIVAIICPVSVDSRSLLIDLPIMIVYVMALVPIMLRGMIVSRGEGILLVSGYAAFLAWQVFAALQEAAGR